jgi:hypothetical protein
MKKILFQHAFKAMILGGLGLSVLSACQQSDNPSVQSGQPSAELIEQGRALTNQFVATLQPTLLGAMQEGGPIGAIEVCAVEAPRIAADLSESSGWAVSRVSLRARNQLSAIPDSWESDVLVQFDQRQLAGDPVEQLNVAAVVDGEFRYMQAQAAGPLCLTCHGSEISSEVQSVLSRHYPQDMATGYSAGQIRGAITVRKPR